MYSIKPEFVIGVIVKTNESIKEVPTKVYRIVTTDPEVVQLIDEGKREAKVKVFYKASVQVGVARMYLEGEM